MSAEFSRRNLFRLKPTDIAQLWVKSRKPAGGAGDQSETPIRPPGALRIDAEFLSACERCHKCAEACPFDVIQQLSPAAGAAEGTPFLMPESQPCHWCPGMDCIHACPSGALLFGENEKVSPIARAVIHLDLCLVSQGVLCDTCAVRCPTDIKAIRMRGRFPVLDGDRCTGCGLCAYHCEAESAAISIRKVCL